MDSLGIQPNRLHRLIRLARGVAHVSFGLFLVLLLGANSAGANGGPLSWLPLLQLPRASGEWAAAGPVMLLPLLSVSAWIAARATGPSGRPFFFGWRRINLPIALLGALALGSLALQCAAGDCHPGTVLRVALLLALFAWVYWFTINEQPDLVPIIATVVILQSAVAAGQFVTQHDLGLRFLGEPRLDPMQRGVSVVMNGGARWLRGYGLTVHPNDAGRTLTTCLLILTVLWPDARGCRRPLIIVASVFGLAGMIATLSRWSWVCLLLGLILALQPAVLRLKAGPVAFSTRKTLVAVGIGLAALAVASALFLNAYGGALSGRLTEGSSALEERSIRERERDLGIALRLLADAPLTGTGFGRYEAAALSVDPWAMVVHNVPLYIGAELGLLGIAAWLLLVILPLLAPDGLFRTPARAGVWLGFWLLGLFYVQPHPLIETRSALLAGLVAGLVTLPRVLTRQQ